MSNIPIYIDDSYWREGENYNMYAISFLKQCLMDNKALFNIHFNKIADDVDEDYRSTMSGTEVTPVDPLLELIHQLRDGKSDDEFVIEKEQIYDKRYFTSLQFDDYRGTIIFTRNKSLVCMEKEYGYGIISDTSYDKLHVLPIEKGQRVSDIDYTSNLKYCNSIIVVDRYALKSIGSIEKNLYPILKKIKSDAPMVLSIFSQFTSRSEMTSLSLIEAYNHIVSLCSPNNKWRVEIYDVEDQYHDRFIITNNNYITIGGGLDCREHIGGNMVGSKTTTMHKYTYPIFQKDISKEVRFYISTINKIKNKNKRKTNMVNGSPNYLITNWI